MSQGVTVKGVRDLVRNISDLTDELQQRALVNGTRAAARVIRDEARVLAPRGTGKLSESVQFKKARTGLKWEVKYTIRPRKVHYWWFVENGTKKMAAQPFLRPAYEANQQEAQDKMQESINRALKRWK